MVFSTAAPLTGAALALSIFSVISLGIGSSLIYLSSFDDIAPSRSRSRMVIKAKKSKPKSTALAIMGADHLPEEDDEDDEYVGDICMFGLYFCAELRYVSDELVAKPNETSSRITN